MKDNIKNHYEPYMTKKTIDEHREGKIKSLKGLLTWQASIKFQSWVSPSTVSISIFIANYHFIGICIFVTGGMDPSGGMD